MDFEPVASFARQNVLSVITLAVVLYFGNGLRSDVDGVRQDMSEMRQGMSEIRQHMYEEHTELRNSIAQVSERLARVETRTELLQLAFVRLEAAITGNPVKLEGTQ